MTTLLSIKKWKRFCVFLYRRYEQNNPNQNMDIFIIATGDKIIGYMPISLWKSNIAGTWAFLRIKTNISAKSLNWSPDKSNIIIWNKGIPENSRIKYPQYFSLFDLYRKNENKWIKGNNINSFLQATLNPAKSEEAIKYLSLFFLWNLTKNKIE